ncbi:MAG: HNH endonuclease [Thermodesulfobacteriota bacterium]|jgi:hypothetical protein
MLVIDRDKSCIYCRRPFTSNTGLRREQASWEHIVNDGSIITIENIALCCIGCNASKGTKTLSSWLMSKYCSRMEITISSIAHVAAASLPQSQTTHAA